MDTQKVASRSGHCDSRFEKDCNEHDRSINKTYQPNAYSNSCNEIRNGAIKRGYSK